MIDLCKTLSSQGVWAVAFAMLVISPALGVPYHYPDQESWRLVVGLVLHNDPIPAYAQFEKISAIEEQTFSNLFTNLKKERVVAGDTLMECTACDPPAPVWGPGGGSGPLYPIVCHDGPGIFIPFLGNYSFDKCTVKYAGKQLRITGPQSTEDLQWSVSICEAHGKGLTTNYVSQSKNTATIGELYCD